MLATLADGLWSDRVGVERFVSLLRQFGALVHAAVIGAKWARGIRVGRHSAICGRCIVADLWARCRARSLVACLLKRRILESASNLKIICS